MASVSNDSIQIFILDSSTESSIMWIEDLKVGVGNIWIWVCCCDCKSWRLSHTNCPLALHNPTLV